MDVRSKLIGSFSRSLAIGLGTSAIAWAAASVPAFWTQASIDDAAQQILIGESFDGQQLNRLRTRLIAISGGSARSLALANVAVVRLRLLEVGSPPSSHLQVNDHSEAVEAVDEALSGAPSNSFLWLAGYWLQELKSDRADHGLQLLKMSYEFGPREAWIAVRRSPLALRMFSILPPELTVASTTEFVGLMRAGLYEDAANILAGPGWPIREMLIGKLAGIGEDDRRRLGKILDAKDLPGSELLRLKKPEAILE